MKFKKKILFSERVVTNTSQNQGYVLPNIIEDTDDIETLIDVIEQDRELFNMVYGIDPSHAGVTAADIWAKIQKNPAGKAIADKYPAAVGFRISSARAAGDGMKKGEGAYKQQDPANPKSTRPIDVYDKRANASNGDIGSFYDFFTSNKFRSNEVSGGSAGEPPLKR